jgi:hypothetical protein
MNIELDFCQLLYSRKTPIVQKYVRSNPGNKAIFFPERRPCQWRVFGRASVAVFRSQRRPVHRRVGLPTDQPDPEGFDGRKDFNRRRKRLEVQLPRQRVLLF